MRIAANLRVITTEEVIVEATLLVVVLPREPQVQHGGSRESKRFSKRLTDTVPHDLLAVVGHLLRRTKLVGMDVVDGVAVEFGDGQGVDVDILFRDTSVFRLGDQVALLVVEEVRGVLGNPLAQSVVEVGHMLRVAPVPGGNRAVAVAAVVGEGLGFPAGIFSGGFRSDVAVGRVGEGAGGLAGDACQAVGRGGVGVGAAAGVMAEAGGFARPVAVGVVGEALRAVGADGGQQAVIRVVGEGLGVAEVAVVPVMVPIPVLAAGDEVGDGGDVVHAVIGEPEALDDGAALRRDPCQAVVEVVTEARSDAVAEGETAHGAEGFVGDVADEDFVVRSRPAVAATATPDVVVAVPCLQAHGGDAAEGVAGVFDGAAVGIGDADDMVGEVIGVGGGVGPARNHARVGQDVAARVVGEGGGAAFVAEEREPADTELTLIIGVGDVVRRRSRIVFREDAVEFVERAVRDHAARVRFFDAVAHGVQRIGRGAGVG